MNLIDAIYYINLDHRTDRNEWMRSNLLEHGVPEGIIHRYSAHNALDYPNLDALVKACAEDGYWMYPELIGDEAEAINERDPGFKGHFACKWAHMNIFRMIIERNQYALILEDDYGLACDFGMFQGMLNEPMNTPGFLVAQLAVNFHQDEEYGDMERDHNGWYRKVRVLGQSANVYSPAGAAFLFGMGLKDYFGNPESNMFHTVSRLGSGNGIFSAPRDYSEALIKASEHSSDSDILKLR